MIKYVIALVLFGASTIWIQHQLFNSCVYQLSIMEEVLPLMKSVKEYTEQISGNSTIGNGIHTSLKKRKTSTGTKQEVPSVHRHNPSNITEYYPWNDRVNYDAVCKSIQKRMNSFKGPPIIHKGDGGGLGHHFFNVFTCIFSYSSLSFSFVN